MLAFDITRALVSVAWYSSLATPFLLIVASMIGRGSKT